MASFQKDIEVSTIDGSRSQKLQAWVDTGAAYTWIPRSVLEQLQVQPRFRGRFKLASGTEIERDCAQVTVSVEESRGVITVCVFGDEGGEPLLGAVTLEEMGLGVDPLNQRLIPVTLLLAPLQ
jgi:aspartyl protease family protein